MLLTKPKHTKRCVQVCLEEPILVLFDSSNGLFKDTKEECMNNLSPAQYTKVIASRWVVNNHHFQYSFIVIQFETDKSIFTLQDILRWIWMVVNVGQMKLSYRLRLTISQKEPVIKIPMTDGDKVWCLFPNKLY